MISHGSWNTGETEIGQYRFINNKYNQTRIAVLVIHAKQRGDHRARWICGSLVGLRLQKGD
jgi:hypothetical protein